MGTCSADRLPVNGNYRRQGFARIVVVIISCYLGCWIAQNSRAFAAGMQQQRVRTDLVRRQAIESGGFLPLDAWEPTVRSYYASSPPLFQEMKDFLQDMPVTSTWAHAVGGTVLFAYAAYAVFLGWQVRQGKGDQIFPVSWGETAAQRHPTMMTYVLLFLVFEIPDGLTLLAVKPENPLLHSTHSSTAVLAVMMMGVVALFGQFASSSKTAREAHAYLGATTVFVLVAHAFFGVRLGLSL